MDNQNIRPNYRVHRIDCCENCKYSDWWEEGVVLLCRVDHIKNKIYQGADEVERMGICDNYKRRER